MLQSRFVTQFKDDLVEAQQRVEAWWRGENAGRPALLITAPRDGAGPYDGPDTDDMDAWWTDPKHVVPGMDHQLRSTAFLAEAMPVVFPLRTGLVAITCKYLGAPNVYLDRSTTWSEPIIHDWDHAPALHFDPENRWWKRTELLMHAAVAMIKERDYQAFVGLPDLNGPTEILSGLRGSEELAMDFYDTPEVIIPALRNVQDAWWEAYRRATAIAHQCGGYFNWMRVWSEQPMIDLQSDFSCLVSTEMFNEYFLPFIVEQARGVERTIYHLDGPDAVRHLDALLAVDEIDAIQWIQGAGGGRTTEWIDLLKRIQDAGKRVWVLCDPDEVRTLSHALDPAGLMLVVEASSESAGEALTRDAERT